MEFWTNKIPSPVCEETIHLKGINDPNYVPIYVNQKWLLFAFDEPLKSHVRFDGTSEIHLARSQNKNKDGKEYYEVSPDQKNLPFLIRPDEPVIVDGYMLVSQVSQPQFDNPLRLIEQRLQPKGLGRTASFIMNFAKTL